MGHRKQVFKVDGIWSCDGHLMTSDLRFPFAFGNKEEPVV